MTVFTVQHADEKNAFGSGVMISAFQDGRVVDALWLIRGEHQSVITDTQMHKVAEGLTRVLNNLPPENLGLKTGGMMLHFNRQIEKNTLYLTERRPEKAQSEEGSVSVPTLEFHIQEGLSEENRGYLVRKLSTPGVLKGWLDSIDMLPEITPEISSKHQRHAPILGGPSGPS